MSQTIPGTEYLTVELGPRRVWNKATTRLSMIHFEIRINNKCPAHQSRVYLATAVSSSAALVVPL